MCSPGHEAHEVELGAQPVDVPRQALLAVATRHLRTNAAVHYMIATQQKNMEEPQGWKALHRVKSTGMRCFGEAHSASRSSCQ